MDLQKSSEQQIEEPVSPSLFELELEAPSELEQASFQISRRVAAPRIVSAFSAR